MFTFKISSSHKKNIQYIHVSNMYTFNITSAYKIISKTYRWGIVHLQDQLWYKEKHSIHTSKWYFHFQDQLCTQENIQCIQISNMFTFKISSAQMTATLVRLLLFDFLWHTVLNPKNLCWKPWYIQAFSHDMCFLLLFTEKNHTVMVLWLCCR